MALIGLGEYLRRLRHYPFAKKVKATGRMTDELWQVFGAVMDTARDQIVAGARMMHPGLAEGAYLDRHAKDKGGLSRLPGETDDLLAARLAVAFDFWRAAGTAPFFVDDIFFYWVILGVALTITRQGDDAYRRTVTITGLPVDVNRFFGDIYKFRPAHQTWEFELGSGLAWAGMDYEYDHGLGWDARPAFDELLEV